MYMQQSPTDIWLPEGDHALLFLHSFTSTPVDFKALSQFFSRHGYTVYAPTLKGHGESTILITLESSINDWAEQALEAFDLLKEKGYQKISVFGLSLGGILATYTALERDVESLGTFSAPLIPDFENHVPYHFDQFVQFEASKRQLSHQPDYQDALEKVLREIDNFIREMSDRYSEISVPVFIGQGTDDEMIDPDIAKEFNERLNHTNVDFHLYPDAPHVITTGRVGHKLRQDVLKFLETI